MRLNSLKSNPKWRAANRERVRLYQARYRAEHKEYFAAYREANREKKRAYDREYNKL